jgi:hypothetical protein
MSVRNIPEYPESRHVALEDKDEIANLFSKHPTEVSERTFGSVYIWRQYAGRSFLSRFQDRLIMTWYRERFGRLMFCPVGDDPAAVIDAFSKAPPKGGEPFKGIFGIVEPTTSALARYGLSPVPLRDEWDYVYLTRDLIELDGPKYHTQRKEMKKATSELDLVYEPMTREHQLQCLQLEEVWCDLKHCRLDKFSEAEDAALKEAISNLDHLGFLGGVVLVDGKVQALTVGERLNPTTAVVHFEKANPEIRGLYQVINQQFCARALKDFEFVNREQDVGEPGLRRAKEGYHPHHFVEKSLLKLP